MNPLRGFSSARGTVSVLLPALLVIISCCNVAVLANNVDHHHLHKGCDTIQRILNGTSSGSINNRLHNTKDNEDEGFLVEHDQWHNHKDLGSICRGRCCSRNVESELARKSTHNFRQTLRHHTNSLRMTMLTTAKLYREHIMELSRQSENKSLHIFAQVYGRLAPYAKTSLAELFANIRSRLRRSNGEETVDIEKLVHSFFVDFFPVVYHHVLLDEMRDNAESKDFRADYKKCIKRTYENILPFGEVPRDLGRSLHQSIGAADVFLGALEQGANVLESVEQLDESHLGGKCSSHLVKMKYCQECDGSRKVKTCHGYCLNVMRGCLTQYVGGLDRPWASFALGVEQLQHMVRSKDGIESVLRSLDGHISEAIMQAMQNGPQLATKVKQLCGSPAMVSVAHGDKNDAMPSMAQAAALGSEQRMLTDVIIPLDTEMIQFLVTIENSQEFYSNLVNSYCEDSDFQQNDKSCWTGDRIGEYSNTVMPSGISSQKYNPEVPYSADEFQTKFEVNQLADKLTNLRQSISIAMTKYSDRLEMDDTMQSDMAEGSALDWDTQPDDFPEGSGAGSGSGPDITTSTTIQPPMHQPQPELETTKRSTAASMHNKHACLLSSLLLAFAAFFTLNRL